MKLNSIKIEGLRKIKDATVLFGDTTFLIGENNVGKSTVFEAVKLILTMSPATEYDFTMEFDSAVNENTKIAEEIVLTAEFVGLPNEAKNWIGFKGRVMEREGDLCIKYRKSYKQPGKAEIEVFEQKKELKEEVKVGNKVNISSLIAAGIDEALVRAHFLEVPDDQNLDVVKYKNLLSTFFEAWNFTGDYEWIKNPGGIPQNVISKLPKFICIPAEHKADEIGGNKTSALGEVMTTIFDDVVDRSANYERVKACFSEFEKEIDTENAETSFGKLMGEVNSTIKGIFPDSQIFAKVNLTDPNTFLKPSYEIKLGSNILTDVTYQGTGMIRATAFSLLKFRENWRSSRTDDLRSLIICFEEPEIFLHPNAASQMRDTIYDLASSDNQIICTTHSPYMIDLSRDKKRQLLNNLSIRPDDGLVRIQPFSVTEEFNKLLECDKSYVKMVLKVDDYIAKVFFCKRVILVEGDTEEIVLRKTISLFNKVEKEKIMADFQIIKARGKATIPPLVKYLKAMGIDQIMVMHDRDAGKEKAEEVNSRILDALDGDENLRILLEEDIESTLGYKAPSKEKPYKAFIHIENWEKPNDIPEKWSEVVNKLFKGYICV